MTEISPYINSREKRALDIVGSGMLLPVSYPMTLLLRTAVLLDDGRPTTMSQPRTAGGGEVIDMPKVRSMLKGSENDPFEEVYNDDPRVTRLGRLLRPPGLDELPQIYEVLRGRMSLVNVRGLHPDDLDQRYDRAAQTDRGRADEWIALRSQVVRPGLTGPTQVKYHLHEGYDEIAVEMDFLANDTLETDIRYLAQTAMMPMKQVMGKVERILDRAA